MDRGQAHIQRQQRGQSFCKRGRQQRCHRFAVADRLHQDGPVDAGVLEETAVGHKQTNLRASMACAQK